MSAPLNLLNKNFPLGRQANRTDTPPVYWNPDKKESINPHLLITATSGAGKTTLLKQIARYLAFAKKHIFLFDLKGDMIIEDENGDPMGNYIEFTAWNSQYGINPFEFDTGATEEELKTYIDDPNILDSKVLADIKFKIQNSGPKVQVERLIEIIKKNFLPNMGTIQKDYLMYLFNDTYLMKGIVFNEIETWNNTLPSLENTLELIEQIKIHFNRGMPKEDNITKEFSREIKPLLINLKTLEDRFLTIKDENEEKSELETNIQKLTDEINKLFEKYKEDGKNSFKEDDIARFNTEKWFEKYRIDFTKYASKEALRTIDKMASYINALVSAGTFHSKRPPVKPGLNIINISGLDVKIQRFIVDIWLGKVFNACKIRGEYASRKNKNRGYKCDTFVMIDESKLIAGTSREKNDPYSYLNRIATEARGVGLGIIVAAQSADHFPPEFLKNFYMQIILNTSIADSDTVRKSFGIDKELLSFVQQGWGNALVKFGRQFVKTKLFDNDERWQIASEYAA